MAEEAIERGEELRRLYARRFADRAGYRDRVWQCLSTDVFSRWVPADAAVLDLGCGYGEFVNNVVAGRRLAMDLNPDVVDRVDGDVEVHVHDCALPWPIESGSLDVVFTSNFLEHLPTKADLRATLEHAHRALRPGGRLVAMGPNVKRVPGAYWDFFDHHLPLTERSLAEVLEDTGFEVVHSVASFLPYTMSDGRERPIWMLRAYLRLPLAWRFLGRQFLVVAERGPHPAS